MARAMGSWGLPFACIGPTRDAPPFPCSSAWLFLAAATERVLWGLPASACGAELRHQALR